MSGRVLSTYNIQQMNNNLLKRYMRMLYTAITKNWHNSHYIKDKILDYDNKRGLNKLIEETDAYYWVNVENGNDSILLNLLWSIGNKLDWDLSPQDENKARKAYLEQLMSYMQRDLTKAEKQFIENEYYNEEE